MIALIRHASRHLRTRPRLGRYALRAIPDIKWTVDIDGIGAFRIRLRRNRSFWLREPLESEKFPFAMLRHLVRPGDVVYDAGANIGLYARYLVQGLHAGCVVAFEPSGLTSITISTSGFDEPSYRRIYRSTTYERFRRNVLALVERNRALPAPLTITIGLRTDRPLAEVMKDPDFQPILAFAPDIDFTWSFTSANGRITREALPAGMRPRVVDSRRKTCVQLYNGPIVLPNGTVMACSCVAAMDAVKDLGIGNLRQQSLAEIWRSARTAEIRASFSKGGLNPTCAGCDMHRGLELYRTGEGRERAKLNAARAAGEFTPRAKKPKGAFSGG